MMSLISREKIYKLGDQEKAVKTGRVDRSEAGIRNFLVGADFSDRVPNALESIFFQHCHMKIALFGYHLI